MIGLEVAAFTLLALAGPGGLALAGMAVAAGASSLGGARPEAGERPLLDDPDERAKVVYLGVAAGVGPGDRSRTWRWPGTRAVDAASMALPARLAARSPLLARIVDDGAYLRSALGSAALAVPVAGVVLGLLAADQTAGRAVPPALAVTVAIAVLGVIDATAGLFAVLTFVVGVLARGGLDSAAAGRTTLGLCALWFVIPVLAGAARPLRRNPSANAHERFDRAADFAIASLIGAWAVQKICIALPVLADQPLPIEAHADEVAVLILVALVVRMLGETLAARLYPLRLVTVEPPSLSEPGAGQRLTAAGLRTGVFVFVAAAVVGDTWQLWVAGLLFLVPQALAVWDERFPKSRALARVLPSGLFEVVLLLFVLTGVGALVLTSVSTSLIADSFVLLAIPGAAISVLHRFGPEQEKPIGWPRRMAGTAILAAGVLQILGLLF